MTIELSTWPPAKGARSSEVGRRSCGAGGRLCQRPTARHSAADAGAFPAGGADANANTSADADCGSHGAATAGDARR